MKNSDGLVQSRGLIIICVAILAFASLPALLSARTPTNSVTITNNSSHVIRNVYLSHVDADDWGADQLSEGATISAGQSFTVSNITWDQPQVKVIGEDEEGCFLSTVVNVGGDVSWTITDNTSRDCGGN